VLERLEGFELRPDDPNDPLKKGEVVSPGNDRRLFPEFYAEYDRTQGFTTSLGNWVCVGPLRYTGHALLERDIANLKAGAAAARAGSAFLPVVAPASVVPERRDEYYKSDEEYVFGIAEALRTEYRAIVAAGLIVQIDDAHLPFMYDRMVPPASLRECRKWARLRIDVLNHALTGVAPERARYHICWGSWNGPHVGDVGLKDIVDLVLKVNVSGYSIEQANPRHEHEWRVWESVKLPAGKVLIPGVISHSTNVVEHPELVAERLVRLARLVGMERVIGGTDCGFAQGPFVRRVHPSVMWAKLRALAAGARIATRALSRPKPVKKKIVANKRRTR
jgi:5-methyltetrahydropteroyltriglutamate--homocysteine methyltransferase